MSYNLRGYLNGIPRELDPAAVVTSADWHTLVNLGINLIGHDSSGRLIGVAAKSWQISSDHKIYEFMLKEQVLDSEGLALDASDWVASFKHLLKSGGSTHSFISEFLDESGVEATSKFTLKITLKKPYLTFLQRLSTPEFILVPKRSIHNNTVDFKVSSGPYFLVRIDPLAGECVLRANPHFFSYSIDQPEEVTLVEVPKNNRDLFNDLISKKLNFALGTILPTDPDFSFIEETIKSGKVISTNVAPSAIGFLLLRDSKRFPSLSHRLSLMRFFLEHAQQIMKSRNSQTAFQLFPPGFEGALPISEQSEILNKILKNQTLPLPKKMIVYAGAISLSTGLAQWTYETLRNSGVTLDTYHATAKEYIPNVDKIDHDFLVLTNGLNAKDPAGTLLYLVGKKHALISDPDGSLADLLESLVQMEAPERALALHKLSRKLLEDGRIIPLIHYGSEILSTPEIDVFPPTQFDDEIRLDSIRRKNNINNNFSIL